MEIQKSAIVDSKENRILETRASLIATHLFTGPKLLGWFSTREMQV